MILTHALFVDPLCRTTQTGECGRNGGQPLTEPGSTFDT